MRKLTFAALLVGSFLAGPVSAQSEADWRMFCTDESALAAFRERVVESDRPLLDWELKLRCPRIDLPTSALHETADPSLETSHTDWVYEASYSADGRTILSAGKDGSLILWDAETGAFIRRIALPQGPAPGAQSSYAYVRSAIFVGDGSTIAGTKDGYPVLLFDASTGEGTAAIPFLAPSPDDFPPRVAATADDVLLIAGPGDSVLAVDLDAMAIKYRLPGHGTAATAVAVSESAGLVATTASGDEAVGLPPRTLLWQLDTGDKIAEFPGEGDGLAFSADGARLAIISGGTVRIYSLAAATLDATIVVHPLFSVFDIAFTADGQGLITCQSHPILWDIATGEIVRHFGPFSDLCHTVDVSPDGRFALTTSMASDLKIWEIATGTFYRRLGVDVHPPR